MESFFRTHKYLIDHLGNVTPRKLINQINWDNRLIGIKGTRGVGKTTFLLHYARELYVENKKECLYVNLNHFYFTVVSIVDFVKEFVASGGRVLLLDQIYKYPNWAAELKACYELYPELKIIFTGSTVMDLEANEAISTLVDVYNLRGFSFREFLNILLDKQFESYTLHDIINNHIAIAQSICGELDPNKHLWDYMHHGYYPFFLEEKNFSENLLKTINMMLEVDVISIHQIEHSYLSKLRKLLFLLSSHSPSKPNISKLSIECDVSRATVSNYLEYLKGARLINMLYQEGDEYPKKPELVYMHNTNLMFPLRLSDIEEKALHETFFYNQVHHNDSRLNKGIAKGVFKVEDEGKKYTFKIESSKYRGAKKSDWIHVVSNQSVGEENKIPLWLFGFLY